MRSGEFRLLVIKSGFNIIFIFALHIIVAVSNLVAL